MFHLSKQDVQPRTFLTKIPTFTSTSCKTAKTVRGNHRRFNWVRFQLKQKKWTFRNKTSWRWSSHTWNIPIMSIHTGRMSISYNYYVTCLPAAGKTRSVSATQLSSLITFLQWILLDLSVAYRIYRIPYYNVRNIDILLSLQIEFHFAERLGAQSSSCFEFRDILDLSVHWY